MIEESIHEPLRANAPKFSEFRAQPYFAITETCHRDELGERIPALLAEMLGWFERHRIVPAGPQLVRYRVVDYNTGNVDIEVGIPADIHQSLEDPRIRRAEIPAGCYITAVHAGPYDTLVESTAALLAWARENRVSLEVTDYGKVTHWSCRIERYLLAPPNVMRPEAWRTEISILLPSAANGGPTTKHPPHF